MIFGGFIPFTLIDYPKRAACVVFTIGCNFRCPYCHNPELVDETVDCTYTEEFILEFLKKRKGILDGVVITGGEPTMHPDLTDFIRRAKALGYFIKLDTNGTNPALLNDLLVNKMIDYVAMDVKAPLDQYARTVGRPVDVAAMQQSIALLSTTQCAHEFRTTVVKSLISPADVEDIAKSIAGARAYYIQKFTPNNILNSQLMKKISYTEDEYEEIRRRASQYVKLCALR